MAAKIVAKTKEELDAMKEELEKIDETKTPSVYATKKAEYDAEIAKFEAAGKMKSAGMGPSAASSTYLASHKPTGPNLMVNTATDMIKSEFTSLAAADYQKEYDRMEAAIDPKATLQKRMAQRQKTTENLTKRIEDMVDDMEKSGRSVAEIRHAVSNYYSMMSASQSIVDNASVDPDALKMAWGKTTDFKAGAVSATPPTEEHTPAPRRTRASTSKPKSSSKPKKGSGRGRGGGKRGGK